jgi:hypothetical protein
VRAQGSAHAEGDDKQRTNIQLLAHPPLLERLREQGQVRASTLP